MSHHHNGRQRKKLRLAEFQEWGFGVTAALVAPLSEVERDKLIEAFLDECVDKRDMVLGGGINESLGFYLVSAEARGSLTEEHRATVQAWLEKRSELKNVVVDPLTDVWRSPH